MLAAGVSALLSALLTHEQLHAWGWRAAFAVGLLIGPVGLHIRRRIDETAEFKGLGAAQKPKSPLRAVLVHNRRDLLLGGGVVAAATAFNYVHKVYMPTYAVRQLHLAATWSFVGAVLTGAIETLAAPVVGALSDRVGRLRTMFGALLLVGTTTWPLFVLLNRFPTVATLLAVQTAVGLLITASVTPVPALLADIFPTGIRGTGLALSYNFSVTLFGGFAPLIVTWLILATRNNLAPSFYVMATATLSIAAVIALGRRRLAARAEAVS